MSALGGRNSTLLNASNATVCTSDRISCCDHEIPEEALLACREYEALGLVSAASCAFWQQYSAEVCRQTCADCESIAWEIYHSCLFLLQTAMSFPQASTFCTGTGYAFRHYRCPSACIDKYTECKSSEYDRCNALCGNYNEAPGVSRAGCVCMQDRVNPGQLDLCEGQTLLDGFVFGLPGVRHRCSLIPDDCKNHKPTTCGYYKHCPVDACVVFNVSCPFLDTCHDPGQCNPYDAKCYYRAKGDGESCDDSLFWTHQDVCRSGQCIGDPNKCQRDQVQCVSPNPCLIANNNTVGGCDPHTGHCVYDTLPDGTACPSYAVSGAGNIVDGTCQGGLCRRSDLSSDPCGDNCTAPGPCWQPPRCTDSGCLSLLWKPEGTPCNDGNPNTHGDQCIEGRCVGDPVPNARYRELGECGSQPPLSLSWRRYSADVPDIQACFDQCSAEPECRAFSHGFQTCSIFGTLRQQSPDLSRWRREWQLETAPARPSLGGMTCFQKGDVTYWASLSDSGRALVAVSICFVVLLPLAWLVHAHRHFLRRSLSLLMSSKAQEVEAATDAVVCPPSPVASGSMVVDSMSIVDKPLEIRELGAAPGQVPVPPPVAPVTLDVADPPGTIG